jgi:hypothetical protein
VSGKGEYQVSRNKKIRKGLKNSRKSEKEFINLRKNLAKAKKKTSGSRKMHQN